MFETNGTMLRFVKLESYKFNAMDLFSVGDLFASGTMDHNSMMQYLHDNTMNPNYVKQEGLFMPNNGNRVTQSNCMPVPGSLSYIRGETPTTSMYSNNNTTSTASPRSFSVLDGNNHGNAARNINNFTLSPTTPSSTEKIKNEVTSPTKMARLDFEDRSNLVTMARFQCRVCGLIRILSLNRIGLPYRQCECGSTSIYITSWIETNPQMELTSGGLGRACERCIRCSRQYSSKRFLKRHQCPVTNDSFDETTAAADIDNNQQIAPGKPIYCNLCGATFLFDLVYQKHQRRLHNLPVSPI